jgi:hypothetical protein
MGRKVEFAQGATLHGLSPEHYKVAYNKGQSASKRFSSASGMSSALEGADDRGANNAWYDGYMDDAAGREKWHIPNCAAHHNGPGGCGQA